MNQLTQQDLLSHADYERERDSFRQRIIALKRRRRIEVGGKISLVFENRATLQFQVQEMVRAERIFDPVKIQDELDVYNALLPGAGELSATLFIEITDQDRIKPDLDALQGIDRGETVALIVGSQAVWGLFEGGHSNDEKLSAVHFVRFHPSRAWLDTLATRGNHATASIRHRTWQASEVVSEALRQEWMADLGLIPAPSGS